MRDRERTALFAVAAAVSCVTAVIVALRAYSGWLAALWCVTVVLLVLSGAPTRWPAAARAGLTGGWRAGLLVAAVVLLPLVPRIAHFSLSLTQPDEFALAWFSHEFHFAQTNLFGPVPPQPVWDHQMPSLFFALQKLFFLAVGETPFDIKLSTMPYVAVTALALFLLADALLGRAGAFVSLLIYAVLAPSVYADTFATPITTSMALFAVFFLLAVLNVRRQEPGLAVLVGVACALCYLGVPTSYLALPFMVAFSGLALACAPWRLVLRSLGASLLAFTVVLLPYAAGAARSANYFAERITRVAPVVGPLFGIKPPPDEMTRSSTGLIEKWSEHIRYLWKDDVGGCAGFNFGQAALFDRVTLGMLAVGVALGFAVKAKRLEFLMVYGVVAGCLFGLGFANPPPMITRYAVLFPLVALILAVPFARLLARSRPPRWLGVGVAAALLAVLIGFNLHHLEEAIARDVSGGREDTEDVKVALYLKQHYPGRAIRVAAFPGFQLEYALRFFIPGVSVTTDYHGNFLATFDTSRDDLYVILFPEEFNPKFLKANPHGVLLTGVSRKYSLFLSRPNP